MADTSPVIGLVKIGHLDLLWRVANQVLIPRAVWDELLQGGADRPETAVIRGMLAAAVRDIESEPHLGEPRIVDRGEAAAVVLAEANPGCLLLIDDAAGRKFAEYRGVRCIGVGGLLLRAKRQSLILNLAGELQALRRHGYFLTEDLVKRLLIAAGEADLST